MKINLSGLCFLLVLTQSTVLLSQEKITHEKRMYRSPEGKLYIQKSLPIYFRISNSPDESATSYLLESEETKKYANPMYLDTEGYNTFRSPSCVDTVTKQVVYPIQDIIYEIYSDSKSPLSNAVFGDKSPFQKNGKFYTQGQLKLQITSKDEMSGVNTIYYSVDSGAYKEYVEPIEFSKEKEYVIKYYAIDNVGNDEDIKMINLIIDASKPLSHIEIEGDSNENNVSGRSKLKVVAEDNHNIKKIFYAIDGSEFKEFKYPVQTKYLAEGDHQIKFYSIDEVDNIEEEKKYDFYVDKTPPTLVQEILGNSIIANGQEYSSGRSKLKLTTFDNKSGVKEVYYSINNGPYEKYDEPFYLSTVSGKLTVRAYALDYVNNKSMENQEMSKSAIPYIDLSGPVIKNNYSGPVFVTRDTVYINKETKIILQARDTEAGLNNTTYSIDGGSIAEYSEPFSIDKEGMHVISFTATDKVDNTNSDDFKVYVDNTGPEIFSRFSTQPVKKESELEVFPSYVVLFFSATDMIVGLDKMIYTMNESTTPKPYDGYIIGFARDKNYKIVLKAFDKLGNYSESVVSFKTDTF